MACNCFVATAVVFFYLYILFHGLVNLGLYILPRNRGAAKAGNIQVEGDQPDGSQSKGILQKGASSEGAPAGGVAVAGGQAENSLAGYAPTNGLQRLGIGRRPSIPSPPWESAPFLNTEARDPKTRAVADKLSEIEKQIFGYKRLWFTGPYHSQLYEIVSRIIEDRKDSPITHAVLLGVGGGAHLFGGIGEKRDLEQFVAFAQICGQLATVCPSLLQNIVVQVPLMPPEWKTALEARGCKVVKDPEAFNFVGANTFLFSAWVEPQYLFPGLEGQPVGELALFMGNHLEQNTIYTETANKLFDRSICNIAPVPCAQLLDKDKTKDPYGDDGLGGLFLWWRPFRTESQKQQDAALRSFASACKIGFPGEFVEFLRAYRLGLPSLPQEKQNIFIYSYSANLYHKNFGSHDGPVLCPDFGEYFTKYIDADVGNADEERGRYEATIDAYLDVLKSGRLFSKLPFQKFLHSGQSRWLLQNWDPLPK
ncbi:hypothetical protein N431DRAFT_534502 [Stipitochalara longipes BDJ]|nr:hypothetical protein N431DRAFT_534502 [Stipitochalara longipes BDJ]